MKSFSSRSSTTFMFGSSENTAWERLSQGSQWAPFDDSISKSVLSSHFFFSCHLCCVLLSATKDVVATHLLKLSVADTQLSSIDAHLWCVVVFSSERVRKKSHNKGVYMCTIFHPITVLIAVKHIISYS